MINDKEVISGFRPSFIVKTLCAFVSLLPFGQCLYGFAAGGVFR